MYVSSGSACTERNSQTPMDPRAIAAQYNRVARVGNRFVRGNVALNVLVQTLGGVGIGSDVPGVTELSQAADFRNAPNCDTSILGDGSLYGGRVSNPAQAPGLNEGGAMLPLSLGGNVTGSAPLPGSPAAYSPATDAGASAAAAASAGGGSAASSTTTSGPGGSPVTEVGPGGLPWHFQTRRAASPFRCSAPQLLPMMTVFPIPATWATRGPVPGVGVRPGTVPAPAAPATPTPTSKTGPGSNAPAAPSGGAPPGGFPTTGNVCLDIALAYVLPSQVSSSQLLQCSLKGYQGVRDGPLLTTAFQTWRNNNPNSLPKVPDQANVPQMTDALAQQYGLGGLGQTAPTGMGLLLVAIGGAALWWAFSQAKGAR